MEFMILFDEDERQRSKRIRLLRAKMCEEMRLREVIPKNRFCADDVSDVDFREMFRRVC